MRLIDADAARTDVWDHSTTPLNEWDTAGVLMMLNRQPTIDAEVVVRCEDCKYRFQNNGHDLSGCPIVDAHIWMDDDDFCSHGERKEGAD